MNTVVVTRRARPWWVRPLFALAVLVAFALLLQQLLPGWLGAASDAGVHFSVNGEAVDVAHAGDFGLLGGLLAAAVGLAVAAVVLFVVLPLTLGLVLLLLVLVAGAVLLPLGLLLAVLLSPLLLLLALGFWALG